LKKLLSIFFLSLFALHHVGYYFAYVALDNRIEDSWQVMFESNDFQEKYLQKMSLPITFPYLTDQAEFIDVDEQMEIGGEFYRIVKKKYTQDTLHLVYVNDIEKKDIHEFYEKWVNNVADNDENTQNRISLNHLLDKQYFSNDFQFELLPSTFNVANHHSFYLDNYLQNYLTIPYPPPKIS